MATPKISTHFSQANLDKLDDNFVRFLQPWATAKFSEAETEEADAKQKTSNLVQTQSIK